MKIADEKRDERKNDPVDRLTSLVRDGIKLGFRLADKNVTDEELEEKTLKIMSPRFLSTVPDNETDSVSVLLNIVIESLSY